MIKPAAFMGIILISLLAFAVFQVENRVQNYRSELLKINSDIVRDRDAIHVLKAEWSYLNHPSRLKAMADKHLSLKFVKSDQIKDVETITLRGVQLTSN